MDVFQIVMMLLIVFIGGFLQGTVAFGFGLFTIPLLLMVGVPLSTILPLTAVSSAVQTASGIHHLRESVPWKGVIKSVVLRTVGLGIGILLLRELSDQPTEQIKFWIGLVMLVLVSLLAFFRPQPRARLHGGWDWTAFLGSGFTSGLCSMGGPPLVLWVMAHDWTANRSRAFLFGAFICLIPLQLILLYWVFGMAMVRGMVWGVVLSPAVLIGSLLGLRVGSRFSKKLLRRLAFLLLIAIALQAMLPYLHGLWMIIGGGVRSRPMLGPGF